MANRGILGDINVVFDWNDHVRTLLQPVGKDETSGLVGSGPRPT